MEKLHLVGVHEDGEHLIVETAASQRYLLTIDQQLRRTVQHARKKPAPRARGANAYGPRDIQARFRAGASVDEICAESGWEPERVKRYEWPILAERAHMVREACKVMVSGTSIAADGYRSVFEGDPRSLGDTVALRAADTGVDSASFDWDAWQREDQLWSVQLRFSVAQPDRAPVNEPPVATWSFNPVTRTVRPLDAWATALGEEPTETGPLGTPAPASAHVAPADEHVRRLQRDARDADELLDVLQSRRGRRLGSDVDQDDRLAEILGRGMGHVDTRPRPIGAPEDSPLFENPIQPAVSRAAEERALAEDGEIRIVDDSDSPEDAEPADHSAPDATSPANLPAAVTAPLTSPTSSVAASGARVAPLRSVPHDDAAHAHAPQVAAESSPAEPSAESSAEDDPAESGTAAPSARPGPEADLQATAQPEAEPQDKDTAQPDATPKHEDTAKPKHEDTAQPENASDDTARQPAPKAPGPRGRTPKARRSSVPSWDEIVFGSSQS